MPRASLFDFPFSLFHILFFRRLRRTWRPHVSFSAYSRDNRGFDRSPGRRWRATVFYPAVEILRGTLKTDGSPDSRSFRVVDTIPGALIDNYRSEDHLHFTDPIAPE